MAGAALRSRAPGHCREEVKVRVPKSRESFATAKVLALICLSSNCMSFSSLTTP